MHDWGVENDVAKHSQLAYVYGSSKTEAAAMYVCLCNGFTDRDIRALGTDGAGSVAMVYRSLGCAPQCGRCVPYVRQMLRQQAAEAEVEAGGDD